MIRLGTIVRSSGHRGNFHQNCQYGRRNKSYQNSGGENKNGLDCDDVFSRLGIIAIASGCMMWNVVAGISLNSADLPKSKINYDCINRTKAVCEAARRPFNVNDVRSAPNLPTATSIVMEHAPTFGIHRFQSSAVLQDGMTKSRNRQRSGFPRLLSASVVNGKPHPGTEVGGFSKNGQPLNVSVRALRGGRFHMEDEFFVGDGGHFTAVYDGHGGGGVSSYLREQLYSAYQKYLGVILRQGCKAPTLGNRVAALRAAFDEVDTKVMLDDDLMDQGSTAVCCILHKEPDTGKKFIISANIGDSRAILCRCDGASVKAIDLTLDHKPGNEKEYARIQSLGGEIEYDFQGGFYRVGNLSVSRAIGDRFAKPLVSGEVDITEFPIDENHDEFILLASDGLYDVMSSQTIVNFVHERLRAPLPDGFPLDDLELLHALMASRRRKAAKFVAKEAVRRGSMDNISVVIVWLKEDVGIGNNND